MATREQGVNGAERLQAAAAEAAAGKHRLLGFYGNGKFNGHLPFATADGDYQPVVGRANKAEAYSKADLSENPNLAEMTRAGITAIARPNQKFWLMVEAGDVDWANHGNNIDSSIGAVFSGEEAVETVFNWIERKKAWDESLVIVTSDHGHFFHLVKPEALIPTD